ncbi:MAG: TonB-dependent receptor plug domain-containing protein [Gammaproteobacteria bacterium]|nr:TonB-dependent receptor plug domain-containing protein [Gammaproteobacteria bacterium]
MSHNFTRKKLAYLIGVSLALPTYSFAQDVEEIIVTAQKREQAILDVPMSITAVTSEEIEKMGATDLAQIQSTVPSLTVNQGSSGNRDTAIIRSIGSDSTNGLPTVGRYVDESNVNTERTGWGITFPMLDLERVEVLKGPQGTLYGEGSIGGAIRYITNSPGLDGIQDLTVEATSNSVDDGGAGHRLMVAGDIPINSDTFGIRAMAFTETVGGWIDNPTWGDEANEFNRDIFRIKALWAPTDTFDADLLYQHYESEQDLAHRSDLDFNNVGFTNRIIEEEYDLTSLTFHWDIGGISITSASSIIDRSANTPSDVSGWVPIIEFFFPGTTIFSAPENRIISEDRLVQQITFSFPVETDSFNHETRFNGTYGDNIFWTAGVYYKDSTFDTQAFSTFFPDPDATGSVAHKVFGELTTEALAFFADVSYEIYDAWEITVGARQYDDERTSVAEGFSFGQSRDIDDGVDNSTLLFRALAKWRYSDTNMVYVGASEGYRSGGVQSSSTWEASGFTVPDTFGAEELWTYELGAKGTLLNGDLRYESALFFSDFQDVQVVEPVLILSAVVNGGEAEIWGFETSLSYDVTDNLFVNLAYSHNDSELLESTPQHLKGEPFDNVPINDTFALSGDYSFNWGAGIAGNLRVDYFKRDGTVQNMQSGRFANKHTEHEGEDTLNMRLGFIRDNWSVHVYAENLLNNEQQLQKPFRSTLDYVIQKPRTLGVTLRWKI